MLSLCILIYKQNETHLSNITEQNKMMKIIVMLLRSIFVIKANEFICISHK